MIITQVIQNHATLTLKNRLSGGRLLRIHCQCQWLTVQEYKRRGRATKIDTLNRPDPLTDSKLVVKYLLPSWVCNKTRSSRDDGLVDEGLQLLKGDRR